MVHISALFFGRCILLQHRLCKSFEVRQLGKAEMMKTLKGLDKQWTLQKMAEVFLIFFLFCSPIYSLLPFIFDAKQNTDELFSPRVRFSSCCMWPQWPLQDGINASSSLIFYYKLQHAHKGHIQWYTQTVLLGEVGGQGGYALRISGGGKKSGIPTEKANFTSGAVVSKLISEPLEWDIVTPWIPSDRPSLNSAFPCEPIRAQHQQPSGKTWPTRGNLKNPARSYGQWEGRNVSLWLFGVKKQCWFWRMTADQQVCFFRMHFLMNC